MRVLVIEDHADTRYVVGVALRRGGHIADLAPDAATAMRLCGEHRYDVMLVDLRLGDSMDGYALLRTLRAAGCRSPAVALTADAFPSDIDRCMAAGFTRHVAKPIEFAALLRLVDQVGRLKLEAWTRDASGDREPDAEPDAIAS